MLRIRCIDLLSIINNNDSTYSYVCDLNNIWYYRLSFVNKKKLNKMASLKLIPKTSATAFSFKCKCCTQGKLTKKSLESV